MTTFTDDFNRADSSILGANWVEVSGDWSIVSSRLSSGSAGGTIILRAAGAMATNDHYAQVTIATTAAASHGVWCRGNANISQGYLWRNDGTSWNLFSVVGGSFTSIGSFAGAAVNGDVAKVQAVGSTIKGFVNGVQRVSVTDTNVTTGTSVGLRAESVSTLRFDDFAAADVTIGVTGDASLTGTATLTGTGLRATTGAAGLTATAGLATDGTRSASGSASHAAFATLATAGAVSTSSSSALAATADLAAAGQRTAADGSGLTATATLAAAGTIGTDGHAALAVTATLAAAEMTSPTGDDIDVNVTVGAPYVRWSAGAPYVPAWSAQAPEAGDWEVGAPC
ncbi:hypothetical protein ACFQ6Q_00745 [Streptomyces sp. NPDC056437]|uniref:hypothetical protein n=1 Tax=Streptomyces sp. NPDC056437 TaxID=3345816 RepID=UPI003674EE62